FSSANLAAASGCWLNCEKQIGARTFATSRVACLSAKAVAEEPVTQPPQVNPRVARATAPPAAPHSAGLTFGEIFIIFPFKEGEKVHLPSPNDRCTRCEHTPLYKTAHQLGSFAAGLANKNRPASISSSNCTNQNHRDRDLSGRNPGLDSWANCGVSGAGTL